MTLADEIRALLKANGPLTALEVRALLPDRRRQDGTTYRTTGRDVSRYLIDGCDVPKRGHLSPMLARIDGDRFQWLRDPPPKLDQQAAKLQALEVRRAYEARRQAKRKAERHARGIVPIAQRALRVKDYADRKAQNADASQAIRARQMGLRDMPADVRPDTDAWLAANADRYERLPSFGPLAVSPASRFTRLKVEA